MATPLKPKKSAQEAHDGEFRKRQLETGYYTMNIGYSNDSETMVDLSSNDYEIDVSPESCDDEDLVLKNRELECCVHDLKRENEMLKMKASDLEAEVSRLKSNTSSSTPLPTLYVQLNAVRKQVSDLEKVNQDLEAENMELNLRLEKKDLGEPSIDGESYEGSKIPLSPLPRRRLQPLARSGSTPVCQNVPSKLTKQQTLQNEDWEAAKLDFTEKLMRKEEVIEKLREQLEASANRLSDLGDGIDALEQRFGMQLTSYHTEVTQKFESLLKAYSDIQTSEKELDQRASAMQFEIKEMLDAFSNDRNELNSRCQSLREENASQIKELEDIVESKNQKLEEAKNQIASMSEETKRQQQRMTELENTIEELEFKISSMKAEKLVPDGMHGVAESAELDAMREHISQLKTSLAEQQRKNDKLRRERDASQGFMFPVVPNAHERETEELEKENKELKKELLEVSEKLVDLEEQNGSLKDEIENHSDFFGQCLSLEEELEANKRINRGLVEHLNRRKKRMEALSKELTTLRQQLGDLEGGRGRKRAKEHKAVMSNLMEEMLMHEKRYEELDKILVGVQAERDGLLQEKASLNKMMHSLIKENKVATQALEKLRSEKPAAQERLEEARVEITKLRAKLKVEVSARQHAGKSLAASAIEEDIMAKLVASQISMAEMDERLMKLRKELHKSVARNMYLTSKSTRLEKQLKEKRAQRESTSHPATSSPTAS